MGIPTLIKTLTASSDSSLDFVDGTDDVTLDSTYDEYMFVFTDMNPETDGAYLGFQCNAAGESDYDETITSSTFRAFHYEDDSNAGVSYNTTADQAEGTAFQYLGYGTGSGGDECCAGILHLFSPASTTYVTHFYAKVNDYQTNDYLWDAYIAGYINTTAAINAIQFKYSAGDFDGVVQMYGIA